LAALYRGQGYVEAHASVSQKAEIRQYLPLKHAGWHAREASKRYIGLENAVRPGSCELTDEMLEAGASFFASSVAYVRKHYGVAIPVKKVPWPEHACDIDQMGFREHHDGINASGVGGCFWNDLVHVDGLRKWSWKQFCDRVNHYLMGEEEELDDQQAKELAETADFVKGLVRGIEAQDVPSRNATDQLKNAYSAGRKIREVWEATKP
jgi:hypothetical protein